MNDVNFSSSFITREEYDQQKAWGMLGSINLYGCNREKITNPQIIKEFINSLCNKIDMKAHGEPHIEKFGEGSLEGYSVMQFIETSSITVHFDDKMGDRAFIDIFSCKYFDVGLAQEFCSNYFEAKESKAWSLSRA